MTHGADESELLNPEKGLIFRITHIRNVPWILVNGIHCRSSTVRDSSFVDIGSADLISKRNLHPVTVEPGGTLGDYVPFYFTPWSPMLLNIKTGRGVPRRPMSEVTIFVSSVPKLVACGLQFVVSDRHAYKLAEFTAGSAGLARVPWADLQTRKFKRDPENPEPFDRYQAEALVHRCVPLPAILGIACNGQHSQQVLEKELHSRSSKLNVVVRPRWFFDF
jgi:hypothetical protein